MVVRLGKRFVLALLLAALGFAVFVAYGVFSGVYASADHVHPAPSPVAVFGDGIPDFTDALTDEASYEMLAKSARPVLLKYTGINEEGKETSAGAFIVTGFAVTDRDVVVSANAFLPKENAVRLAEAVLLPTLDDRNRTPEVLDIENVVINEQLTLAALPRPENRTLDIVPITVDDAVELPEGIRLIALRAKALPIGESAFGYFAYDELRAGLSLNGFTFAFTHQKMFAQPVFFVKDGVPTFVGITTFNVDQETIAIAGADHLREFLRVLGVEEAK